MNRHIPTRWSHLLRYSGIGAIIRGDENLLVVTDIRQWTTRDGAPAGEPIYYVDLLRGALQITKELRQPPLARERPNGAIDGTCIPAVRFPGWMRCPSPSCGLLHYQPWRRDDGRDHPVCICSDDSRLQQVNWVVAHAEGGLRDVPWHAMAHEEVRGGGQQCRPDPQQAFLHLTSDSSGSRLLRLRCGRCRAQAELAAGRPLKESYPRRQPWERSASHRGVEAKDPARILEVNDPRIYYPRTRNALVIPPESRIRRGTVVDRLYCNRQHRQRLDQCRTSLGRRAELRLLADHYGCSADEVEAAWDKIQDGYPLDGRTLTPGDLLSSEFEALVEEIPGLFDDEDFVPRHKTRDWQALAEPHGDDAATGCVLAAVDRLVSVARLREIQVFDGFSRITQDHLVPPDLDSSVDWLPAIELFGEGIFFTLDESMLARWGAQPDLIERAEHLQRRFERSGMRFPNDPPSPISPRFVLLHTLAHMLIRQLESAAGYPAASIRERIYCAGGSRPMAGILVYVAVPDVVGSLGGLAELAEPGRFLPLLASVFDHADWCSLDPVCCEHEGQGPSLLNLAACHACALVPEPSCAYGNVLLDRTLVKGDFAGGIEPLLAFATEDG